MKLDYVDYISNGNQDNYWLCKKCNARAVEIVRYGKSIKVEIIEDDKMEEK